MPEIKEEVEGIELCDEKIFNECLEEVFNVID